MLASAGSWVMTHQVICGVLGMAVLDFAFGVNENLKSNGILHLLYLLFTKEAGK